MWCGTRVPAVGTTSQLDQGVQHRVVGDLLARAARWCTRAASAPAALTPHTGRQYTPRWRKERTVNDTPARFGRGVLQRFSRKGWDVDQSFEVVRQNVQGRYREHRGIPTNCFGDTPYFADGFTIVPPATR